ncbi:DUF6779 domain-containing protein [Gordonia sp. w5E2]|uniref:DUF6779 domain-containing protein n=1 Tax=Gordonia TaxID=2053 RepID=UPI0007EBFBA2|nr:MULTISPECIES: DUF6779 domain-containing protein [Gordonia]OBC10133.1 hypothetical protein A5785_22305 [Gordonia sp. 852002-50395_SCH5434458]OBC17720.1 hypothetical protein A5786_18480 [Gordonia sp. 852002-50816_SCH5313054-a]OBC19294.1 hypothetical protein A5788_09095 [Gordonia sp. 852002-50816_SCH5313054-c]
MTTSTGRAADTRRSGRVGQWLVGLLIVLAVVASVLMLFTDQISVLGSLAVIAALWAAVIAAILVTRYRRQAESAESKSRDLRLVYELQLEREIAARRQYELDVESTIRKEISDEAGVELAELKAQVLALRSSLEMLLGESLPDQRAALPNEKLRELASGLGGLGAESGQSHTGYGNGGYGDSGYSGGYGTTDYTAHDDGAVAARDFEQTAPGAEHRRRDSRPFDAPRRFGTDVDPNELTEVLPVVPGDAPISGRIAAEVPLDDIHAEDTAVEYGAVEYGAVEYAAVEDVSADEVETVAVDEELAAQAEADQQNVGPEGSGTEGSGTEGLGAAGSGPEFGPEDFGAEEVRADEVVVDVVDEQPRAPYTSGYDEEPPAGSTSASPFSGGFYVPTAETTPSAADTVAAPEQEAQAETATSAPESGDSETVDTPDSAAGRHETGDGAPASTYSGGRRRREDDEDHDAAHTAGLPVAELLNQLRQSPGGSGGGRRRRED